MTFTKTTCCSALALMAAFGFLTVSSAQAKPAVQVNTQVAPGGGVVHNCVWGDDQTPAPASECQNVTVQGYEHPLIHGSNGTTYQQREAGTGGNIVRPKKRIKPVIMSDDDTGTQTPPIIVDMPPPQIDPSAFDHEPEVVDMPPPQLDPSALEPEIVDMPPPQIDPNAFNHDDDSHFNDTPAHNGAFSGGGVAHTPPIYVPPVKPQLGTSDTGTQTPPIYIPPVKKPVVVDVK